MTSRGNVSLSSASASALLRSLGSVLGSPPAPNCCGRAPKASVVAETSGARAKSGALLEEDARAAAECAAASADASESEALSAATVWKFPRYI